MKNLRIIKIGTIIVSIIISYSCFGESSKEEFINTLNNAINSTMKENHIPGLAIGISFQNDDSICKYYGKSNLTYDIPVTDNSTFAIGSITKTFTAIAILKLCQEGKLNLNTKLSKFFPDFPNSENITIKELLNHSSGIKDVFQIKKLMDFVAHQWTPEQVISMAAKESANFRPGSEFMYNNTAYIILGKIIEKITDKTYDNYLKNDVLEPLGISNTYIEKHIQIVKNKASGYEFHKDHLINNMYVCNSWIWSAGGLYSNVQNILKLKKVFDAEKILNKKSIKEMLTQSKEPGKNRFSQYDTYYGLGVSMMKLPNRTLVGKEGGMSGFTAYLCYLQKENILLIIMCNLDGQNHALINLTQNLVPEILNYNIKSLHLTSDN